MQIEVILLNHVHVLKLTSSYTFLLRQLIAIQNKHFQNEQTKNGKFKKKNSRKKIEILSVQCIFLKMEIVNLQPQLKRHCCRQTRFYFFKNR